MRQRVLVADTIRFYDENVPTAVADQRRLRGIDAVTVRGLGLLGDQDHNHLRRAISMGRVLCTCDTDFLTLVRTVETHAGIVFGRQQIHYIGEWVNFLTLLHAVYSAADMQNHIEYI